MLKNIRNFFRKSQPLEEEFLLGLKRKGLKALKKQRARLRERVAFAENEIARQRDMKFLQAVEEEIKNREKVDDA